VTREVRVGNIVVGGDGRLALIAGPCVIEEETGVMTLARQLKEFCGSLDIPLIFKASYDKANRTSLSSYRGPGIGAGLAVLQKVKDVVGVPVLSDVHQVGELAQAADVLDVIQIPAFLSRQTDLLVEAGRTGKPVNVKKGQFLAPWDMIYAIEKIRSTGNDQIILTERGTTFGYNTLVADMKALPIMRNMGYPVIFDATHSVQLPGGAGKSSGGLREYIPHLARAAVAAGVDGVFLEVHPEPDRALCDGPNSLDLETFPVLVTQLIAIDQIVKKVKA